MFGFCGSLYLLIDVACGIVVILVHYFIVCFLLLLYFDELRLMVTFCLLDYLLVCGGVLGLW